MPSATPPTAAPQASAVEARLSAILQEIEEMATELPGATLAAAARRIAMLAAAAGAQGGQDLTNLPVLQLTFDAGATADEQNDEQADDARSVAASADSLDADAHADADGTGDGGWFDDERLWYGGPLPEPFVYAVVVPADVYDAADDGEDGNDDGESRGAERDTRLGFWHGRDSIGLAAHGRDMYASPRWCLRTCDPQHAHTPDMFAATQVLRLLRPERRRADRVHGRRHAPAVAHR